MPRLRRLLASLVAALAVVTSTSIAISPPASAGTANGKGARCDGYYAASVCAYINFDSLHKRIRAYGSTTNLAPQSVAVKAVVCLETRGYGWSRIDHCGQADGDYGPYGVSANTRSAMYNACHVSVEYRAVVFWEWWDINSGGAPVGGVMFSNPVAGYYCL